MSHTALYCSSRPRRARSASCARILAAALLLSPLGPALAQAPVPASPDAVLAECQKAIGKAPRYKLSGCLVEKLAQADRALKEAGKLAHRAVDVGSSASPQALKSLAAAEHAFGAFREAECQRRGDAMLGGSGAGDAQGACAVWLTYWYAAQLRQN